MPGAAAFQARQRELREPRGAGAFAGAGGEAGDVHGRPVLTGLHDREGRWRAERRKAVRDTGAVGANLEMCETVVRRSRTCARSGDRSLLNQRAAVQPAALVRVRDVSTLCQHPAAHCPGLYKRATATERSLSSVPPVLHNNYYSGRHIPALLGRRYFVTQTHNKSICQPILFVASWFFYNTGDEDSQRYTRGNYNL